MTYFSEEIPRDVRNSPETSSCPGPPIDALLCAQVTARFVAGESGGNEPFVRIVNANRDLNIDQDLHYREHPLPMVMNVKIGVCAL